MDNQQNSNPPEPPEPIILDENAPINEADLQEGMNDKIRSFVWNHFKYFKGIKSAVCPYCKIVLKCENRRNGTSSLGKHLTHYCPTSPVYKSKGGVKDKKQPTISFKSTEMGEGNDVLKMYSFNQENCRKALALMCIKDNRPFSIVDDEGFKEFSWELNPRFKLPSRWTVTRDCLKIYKDEVVKLKKLLKGQRVSLTTDTWTSVQNINYMCLTAHWIDSDWKLQKRILNFCQIANHKGETIGKLVNACLVKWGIDKIFTVTVDNASSNDGAIRFLKKTFRGPDSILDGKYMHLRCCAHILNLIVRDGLEEQNNSIMKVRKAVRYVRSSPSRLAKFKNCVEKEKINCGRKVCLDVDTRWNSTYLMLETAIKFEKAFDRLEWDDENYLGYFDNGDDEDIVNNTRKRKGKERVVGAPNSVDWENVKFLVEFLKMFYEVTLKISGSKFVTSNLFFMELVKMHVTLVRMASNENSLCVDMAKSMKAKFDKYWDNIDNVNFLLHVALVLDPRKKMYYLDLCFGEIYGNDTKKRNDMHEKVIQTLNDLYNQFKGHGEVSNGVNKSGVHVGDVNQMELDGDLETLTPTIVDLDALFLKRMEEEEGRARLSEVETYLADGKEKGNDDTFDILNWWDRNSVKFPVLSQLAKNVLAMPISSVSSESAFSVGGRVIDPFRSSLTPRTAEALICAQDWLRSKPMEMGIPHVIAVNEVEEQLENIEMEEFADGPKVSEECVLNE